MGTQTNFLQANLDPEIGLRPHYPYSSAPTLSRSAGTTSRSNQG